MKTDDNGHQVSWVQVDHTNMQHLNSLGMGIALRFVRWGCEDKVEIVTCMTCHETDRIICVHKI